LQLLAQIYQGYEAWAEDVRMEGDEAQASIDRGEGMPLDVAIAIDRHKTLGDSPEDNIATIIRADELFPCLAKLKFDNRFIVGMKISNDSLSLPIENPNPLINRDRQMSAIGMHL
jgi:hypothetical protein